MNRTSRHERAILDERPPAAAGERLAADALADAATRRGEQTLTVLRPPEYE